MDADVRLPVSRECNTAWYCWYFYSLVFGLCQCVHINCTVWIFTSDLKPWFALFFLNIPAQSTDQVWYFCFSDTFQQTHTRTHTCTHARSHTHTQMLKHTHNHTNSHVHACTHTCTRTCMHACTHMLTLAPLSSKNSGRKLMMELCVDYKVSTSSQSWNRCD